MFDLSRKKWRLGRLMQQRESLGMVYDKKIADARATNNRDGAEKWIAEMFMEFDLADDEINKLRTSILMKEARRYLLPTPSEKGDWEDSKIDGRRFLTQGAQRALIVAIRAETKERAELFGLRVAGLTGVIGALTGLVAVLLTHR